MDPQYHILIVEDSETQALKLRVILEDQGWRVSTAAEGETALEQINRELPDMIVVDYHLPRISGSEFCRTIRMNIQTRSVPILMFTADDTQAAQLRSLESGADDYMPKSADPDILLLRVRALLRKSQAKSGIGGAGDSSFHKARLLAVDDSPTYLEFLSEELKSEGYSVEKAGSGKAALERLKNESFDCVLVDLVMPEMDGIAVCQELNRFRRNMASPIVVLMLTARENKDDMTQGLEAGADDFVGKSSDKAVLKGRIRALLRRKFFQEENQRILEELKNKELEIIRARASQDIAEARASLVDKLEKSGAELIRTNQELEAFSYSVSHDLRAPLRHVQGYVEMLRKSSDGALDEKSRGYLQTISDASGEMGQLIDDLLMFSRLGRSELHEGDVNLDSLVQSAIKGQEMPMRDRNIVWKISALPTVRGDSSLLRQVFVNLISNAVKYSRPRDPAIIEIACGPDKDGRRVVFVRDNGVGFDMQYAHRLFGVFQRLHRSEEFEGTGIGLANVRRIVTRHGGEVWAESKPGEGTTMFVALKPSPAETAILRSEPCPTSPARAARRGQPPGRRADHVGPAGLSRGQ